MKSSTSDSCTGRTVKRRAGQGLADFVWFLINTDQTARCTARVLDSPFEREHSLVYSLARATRCAQNWRTDSHYCCIEHITFETRGTKLRHCFVPSIIHLLWLRGPVGGCWVWYNWKKRRGNRETHAPRGTSYLGDRGKGKKKKKKNGFDSTMLGTKLPLIETGDGSWDSLLFPVQCSAGFIGCLLAGLFPLVSWWGIFRLQGRWFFLQYFCEGCNGSNVKCNWV